MYVILKSVRIFICRSLTKVVIQRICPMINSPCTLHHDVSVVIKVCFGDLFCKVLSIQKKIASNWPIFFRTFFGLNQRCPIQGTFQRCMMNSSCTFHNVFDLSTRVLGYPALEISIHQNSNCAFQETYYLILFIQQLSNINSYVYSA